jgi:predicted nucleic acid-binding Zn finger protein
MRQILVTLTALLLFGTAFSQKRLQPPKKSTKVESVDTFVTSAFTIYNTTFDFHYGATQEVEDTDATKEKDQLEMLEEQINNMIDSVPDIVDEIEKQSVATKLRATLNLNKAVKALKQSGKFVKMELTGGN